MDSPQTEGTLDLACVQFVEYRLVKGFYLLDSCKMLLNFYVAFRKYENTGNGTTH